MFRSRNNRFTKRQRLVLVICILASSVAFLDGSVVNVALPAITRELGGGLGVQQWVVDAYLITLGSLMLVAGSFSDLFGRVRIMSIGLTAFALTSLLCAAASSGELLIAARALQGIAGALLVPSSLALIISAFDGPKQGKAIGTWTAWTGIAFVIGPLLGGLMVDTLSWRWIFVINVIPVVLTLWFIRILRFKETRSVAAHIDTVGTLLCAFGLGVSVFALIEEAHFGWKSPVIYVSFISGIISLALFIQHEKRTTAPMLPLELFKVRNFSVGNISTAMIYAGLSMFSFLVTVFVQQVGGYKALEAGLAMLPITIIMFVLSSRFGSLASRFGPRLFMTIGPLLSGLGAVLMLTVDHSANYVTQLLPGIILFGIGLSVTVAPLTTTILGSISHTQAGIGSAINNAISRIAGLLGIAAIGLITGPVLNLATFHKSLTVVALLLALGGVVSLIGIQKQAKLTKA